MLFHGINDNILISHLSYLGVYQDEAKNDISTKISICLGLELNQTNLTKW